MRASDTSGQEVGAYQVSGNKQIWTPDLVPGQSSGAVCIGKLPRSSTRIRRNHSKTLANHVKSIGGYYHGKPFQDPGKSLVFTLNPLVDIAIHLK